MRRNRSMSYALQVAACEICLRPVDIQIDCYRKNREAGGLVHVLCLAALAAIEESPSRLDYEVASDVNDAADDLYAALCENPDHDEAIEG